MGQHFFDAPRLRLNVDPAGGLADHPQLAYFGLGVNISAFLAEIFELEDADRNREGLFDATADR